MEQNELNIEEDQVESYDDKSNDVFMILFISIFLTFGTYAFFDQLFNLQIELVNLISIIFGYFILFCLTIIYEKANEAGWKAFIPLYNLYILVRIVRKPAWWTILLLIPGVNIVFSIWVINLISLKFGKDVGFTLGLVIVPIVFYPILAFGDSKYMKD